MWKCMAGGVVSFSRRVALEVTIAGFLLLSGLSYWSDIEWLHKLVNIFLCFSVVFYLSLLIVGFVIGGALLGSRKPPPHN